jgi:hypothetical protein
VDESNPYLDEFLRLQGELATAPENASVLHGGRPLTAYERRVWCVRRYAFAVPTPLALATLARYAPIIEVGAGNGYWTFLLRRRGVDCVAYDLAPPDRVANPNGFGPSTWTHVEQGDVEVVKAHTDRALFLCWPSYRDAFAARALNLYTGKTLLYIGEAAGGHTADETFFATIAEHWERVEEIGLPNWPGTRDTLSVYSRTKDNVRVVVSRLQLGEADAAVVHNTDAPSGTGI